MVWYGTASGTDDQVNGQQEGQAGDTQGRPTSPHFRGGACAGRDNGIRPPDSGARKEVKLFTDDERRTMDETRNRIEAAERQRKARELFDVLWLAILTAGCMIGAFLLGYFARGF